MPKKIIAAALFLLPFMVGATTSVLSTVKYPNGATYDGVQEKCVTETLPTVVGDNGVKPAVTGGGTFVMVSDASGKCPDGYILSLSKIGGKECLKVSWSNPTEVVAPTEGIKPSVSGSGVVNIIPENGKCPDGYVVNENRTKCLKPLIPTVYIAPKFGVKEAIFSGEEGVKVNIGKSGSADSNMTIAPKEGFKVVVPYVVGQGTNSQIKEVGVERSIKGKNETLITADKITATTKEEVKVADEKITVSNEEVKIMPDTASETAVASLEKAQIVSVELKTVGQADDKKPVYEVQAEQDMRLVGLIKVKIPVTVSIDAEKGNIIEINKPWWGFLAF